MDTGNAIAGIGLGAAKGYFDHRARQEAAKDSDKRLAKEQQRQIKLLERREAIKASYDMALEDKKHKNAMALAGDKGNGFSEKEIEKFRIKAQEGYNKYRAEINPDMGDVEVSREEYYRKNYPDHLEWLGVSQKDTESREDSSTGSFVKNVLNRVKGKGGPSPEAPMIASHSSGNSETVVNLPVKKKGGVASASEYSPEEHGYPAPLDMTTIPKDSESDVKTIKADKAKVVKETEPIKKAAERAVSSGVKNKSLQKGIGEWTKAVREGDATKIYEWAEKLEKILSEVGNGKFLKEIRSMGREFQRGSGKTKES